MPNLSFITVELNLLVYLSVSWLCVSFWANVISVGYNLVLQHLAYTPVTPNGDFTATFGDFKFGLVARDRCVVAFNRHLAVTPEHRSQQIAAFLHN